MTSTESIQPNARDLLIGIGLGHFNATQIIQYMFIAPAATDPKAPPVMLLIDHVQKQLIMMGSPNVQPSGVIDDATNDALTMICGDHWLGMPWSQVVGCVLDARDAQVSLKPPPRPGIKVKQQSKGLSGILDAPSFLPDVPGGLVTYGVAGYLVYRLLTKGKKS